MTADEKLDELLKWVDAVGNHYGNPIENMEVFRILTALKSENIDEWVYSYTDEHITESDLSKMILGEGGK